MCIQRIALNLFLRFVTVAALAIAGLSVRGQIVLSNYSGANPVKIMPVGDSITDDCSVNGAWRQPLQALLETNAFPFTFVGRQSSPTNPSNPGFTKRNHEGYCGSVIAAPGVFSAHQYLGPQNYLQRIVPDALVTNANPDVMLIWIAANDINNGRNPFVVATNHMATLLNQIFSNAPNINVLLTKATRQENYAGAIYATNIPIYNAALQAMVNQRRALGQKVFLADLYSVVTYPSLFSDGLHPNAAGLQLAANEWFARLQTITVRTDQVSTVLLNGGANWRYNDTGQDLGTNWTAIAYDDSGWSNGVARLGYGDFVTATVVSFGAQPSNKNITTYFRRPFVVPTNTVITNLNLRVAQADGAIVYLNGQELYRTNLPAGPISYTNRASSVLTYYSRYTFVPVNIPVALTAGTNWIAAEVHLSSPSAGTMGFDMELIGTGYPGQLIGSLQLSVPSSANEDAGTLVGQGRVSVNVAPTNDLTVSLSSSDVLAVSVPSSVIIPAGQTNMTFDVTVVDDGILNTGRVAVITASANSYSFSRATMTVFNTDVPHLISLSTPSAATEGDGTLVGQGNVSVSPAPTNVLTVNLGSSDTSEVTVPSSVMIPAGQTNAVFDLTIVDDPVLDGDQVATITASALHYTNAQSSITVHDNETAALSVTLPASASEGTGTWPNAGRVSLGTAVAANIVVSLSSSDTSRLVLPPTAIISNGQTSAVFNLTFVNNNVIDGPHDVSVTAHFDNWTDGSALMTILDDDPLPDHFGWSLIPSPQLIGEPFHVTITAQDAANNTLDYRLPVTMSALMAGSVMGTNEILNSPNPEQSLNDGFEYVLGYSFTPNTNLTVTHVRHYFGDKVSIWNASGQLLASRNVVSLSGSWVETPLSTPLVLAAGASYVITVHENGVPYFWSEDLPTTFADGTINHSSWDYGDVFPLQSDGVQWYLVDLRYATGSLSVPISPGASGSFSNGIWSGNLTVLQAATNVMLKAGAGDPHAGVSVPFNVLGTPKLAIAAFNNSVVLSWPTAASGFILEQSAALRNWTNSSVTPSVIGDRYLVTNAVGAAPQYYRLRKP